MSYAFDQPIASASQTTEFRCPNTEKVIVQVSNGKVYLSFGLGHPIPVYGPEEPYLPVVGTLMRSCDAIKVRASAPVPTPPPQVSLTAVAHGES